jgi:DoxX-like protein
MQTMAQANSPGAIAADRASGAVWTGRTLSALAVLFLALDSAGKLLEVPPVMAGSTQLGYPASTVFGLGMTLLLCLIAYVMPPTSALGAVLLTGFLGGAVATHVRVGSPWLTHTLFPVYVASLVWGGLLLRDPRVRALLPWRARH